MALRYVLASTSFAGLCSLIWLLAGGTFLSALLLYVLSGQVALVSLITMALMASRSGKNTPD